MSDLPSTCIKAVLPGPAQYIDTVKIRKNCAYSFRLGTNQYIKNYIITDEVPGKYTHEWKTVTIFPNTDKEQTLSAIYIQNYYTSFWPKNYILTSIIQGLDLPSCRFGNNKNSLYANLANHITIIGDILSGDYHNPGFDWKWYDQQTKVYPLPDQYQNLGICSGLCMWNPFDSISYNWGILWVTPPKTIITNYPRGGALYNSDNRTDVIYDNTYNTLSTESLPLHFRSIKIIDPNDTYLYYTKDLTSFINIDRHYPSTTFLNYDNGNVTQCLAEDQAPSCFKTFTNIIFNQYKLVEGY